MLSTQNEEGGWGESLESCPSEVIAQTEMFVNKFCATVECITNKVITQKLVLSFKILLFKC